MRVEVAANILSEDDACTAVLHCADSVGLLRSEFLFVGRSRPSITCKLKLVRLYWTSCRVGSAAMVRCIMNAVQLF